MSIWVGIDIETKSLDDAHQEYALMPWTLAVGKSAITDISVSTSDGKSKTIPYTPHGALALFKELAEMKAQLIWWNGIFDLAFLYAAGHDLSGFLHVDGMHLWKWVKNSQRTELGTHKWDLASAAKYWLKDLPWIDEFVAMKKAGNDKVAGEDSKYWTDRASMDAYATVLIAKRCWDELTEQQRRAAAVEGMCMMPNAKAWFKGIRINVHKCAEMAPILTHEMELIERRLGVRNAEPVWKPSTILRSPKQKAKLVYETWGFECKRFTDRNAPSTDKAALTYLADQDDRFIDLLRWSELNTQVSKFINTPQEASKYLESTYLHPSPKLFSTYTGRMTYTGKTKNKFKTGCALHQWPRNKNLRKLVCPPPGKKLVEFDASGQESRIMAIQSQDHTLLSIFQNDMDVHSYMGSRLGGIPYEKFLELKAAGNEVVTGEHGLRYQGKFCNLSMQYRAGAKTLRIQSRVQYGMDVDFQTVINWKTAYLQTYPGIEHYWKTAIRKAKELGYAETLAGRRFYIDRWSQDYRWGSESSAINFPIQGTGGDMKELAVAVLTQKHPEFEYAFDLHDALFGYVDEDMPDEQLLVMRETLNSLPYESVWGVKPPIPLLWDCQVGPNWGEMKEL
jgi:DNA polymerase-1